MPLAKTPGCRLWLAAPLLMACGPALLVPLGPEPTSAPGAEAPPSIEVLARGISEPLSLRGERVAYGDLDRALVQAVTAQARPWAEGHLAQRAGGWQLLIEITQAEARRRAGRVTVTLSGRATLRAQVGKIYLAQTQTYCRESAAAQAQAAAPVFHACMADIGRDLTGWLGGVQP